MATHTHSALPSFSDVLHDFGFQLATVREPRLTQAQLANAINKLANKALLDAEFEYDERKEALDARLKDATAALADSQSVGTVDGKLVKEWERGRQFPTDAQYKHIKLAFKELAPLTQEEEEKLDNAFRSGKTVAKKGQNTETFGDTFDEILSKRMNEMKPPAVGSYNDFADMIMLVSDEKETDKLRADVEAAQKAIEELKPVKPKNFFLVDGEGKKMGLVDAKGNLSMTDEHLRMIEHGIIPSGDLFEVLKEALGKIKRLEAGEENDLNGKYTSLVADATAHFTALQHRGVLKHDPFDGEAPPAPALQPKPIADESEPPPPPTPPAGGTNSTPSLIIGDGIVSSLTPITNNNLTVPITKPPVVFAPRPKPPAEIETVPISGMQQNHVAELAETYATIFATFGHVAPSITDESTARADNSGGKRAELARTIGLRAASSIPELRPFSLKPLKDETITALVARAPKPREMMELTRKYNELVETIREDIAHSEAGRDLSDSLDAFKTTLSRSKGHTFDDIKYMDSKTGVSPANFEDYYTHGGLHMREAPDMEEVLESVNAHWKTGNGGRNVLKHDEHSWKGEARTYISAHQRVRAAYESLSRAFESAMSTQLDKVRHNTALREQAEEYATLDIKYLMQEQYPRDQDMRLSNVDLARYRELGQRFREEPEFAEALARARENHSHMDAMRDRKNATGTGTPG